MKETPYTQFLRRILEEKGFLSYNLSVGLINRISYQNEIIHELQAKILNLCIENEN